MLKNISCCMLLLMCACAVSAQNDEDKEQESSKRPSWSSGLPERQSTNDPSKPEFKPEIDNEIELDMSEFGIKPKAEIELDLPIRAELPIGSENNETETEVANDPVEEQPVNIEPEAEPVSQPVVETSTEEQSTVETPSVEDLTEQVPAQTVEPTPIEEDAPVAEEISIDKETVEAEEQVAIPEENLVEEPPVSQPEEANESAQDNSAANYQWVIIKQDPVKYPVKAAMSNLEGWVEVEIEINPAGEVVSASAIKYSFKGRVFGKPAVQSVNGWLFEPPSDFGITTNLTRVYKIEFDL